MTKPIRSFFQWLVQQQQRNDAVGEFATDTVQAAFMGNEVSPQPPVHTSYCEPWQKYAMDAATCAADLRGFDLAFDEYLRTYPENMEEHV